MCTEKPNVPGDIGVNPQGFDTGVFFCGVCITTGSAGLALTTTPTPAGGGNRLLELAPNGELAKAAAAFAPRGEATAANASLIAPPMRPCGLDRPSNLGRALPLCAWGEGGKRAPGDGVGGKGEGASAIMESTRRLPLAFEGQAGPGDGVGGKANRVGDIWQGELRLADALVQGKGEAAEMQCWAAPLGVHCGERMSSMRKRWTQPCVCSFSSLSVQTTAW